MPVEKELIKQRKKIYGDNFECIAEQWQDSTGNLGINGSDVALMMAQMKQCRINAIKAKLKAFPPPDVYITLEKSLQDSEDDRDNYLWIGKNYEAYKKL